MGDVAGQVQGALAGITVLEPASYITGPLAGALLADLGAEVIKIEPPPQGDPFRGPDSTSYHPSFASLNRNKKSLMLNLRQKEGRQVFLRLAQGADVVIENFRPGTMERLGLGYEVLSRTNPRLVFCSVSGFGQSGPYRDKPAYDTVAQGYSGMLSLLTEVKAPKAPGVSFADHLSGIFASHGILAALLARQATGRGQKVETSMLQATTFLLGIYFAAYFKEGRLSSGEARARSIPIFGFVAGDGLPFVIHLSTPPKFWENLVAATGHPEIGSDPRFRDRKSRTENYGVLCQVLQDTLGKGPRAFWLRRLEEHDIPCAPVNTLDQVFEDPQVTHLGLTREVLHPTAGLFRLLRSPVDLLGTPTDIRSPAPLPGQHTEEILRRLGLQQEQIADLRAAGAV